MEELRGFNLDKLYQKLVLPDADFVLWLQELRLLHPKRMVSS
jgi:hypothetical protein